ncbi:MAG: sulfur carrier protein ThiS adenylyltransferase ThiF [Candidatus Delongbacteria bacterium]|nr:sulfur carrier protein ThiS adenylyltransferase ThiF [Candidatus Delongbacteria bacterium]MCG2760315.1 sulfur carrier protein ThiS adenylyltransferase ThiF [Candidatus Delongbacteria bacterium]
MIEIFSKNVSGMTEKLSRSTIAIAGCGGIGSNVAVSLVRAGIGKLIIADMDIIEASNLNRQYFFIEEIGKTKVLTLKSRLENINPDCEIISYHKELTRDDVSGIFSGADIMIEAFDKAESKQWLIEEWGFLYPDKPIISGNGLSGCGNFESIKIRQVGNIYFCGDGVTSFEIGLCSARVAIVSNIQANLAIELIMNSK